MTDRDPIWDALKEHSKSKFDADREQFMAQAIEHDDGGWTKHTEYHWSRTVGGKRLDYWPSRKKWQYEGNIRRGDVQAFIRSKPVQGMAVTASAIAVATSQNRSR